MNAKMTTLSRGSPPNRRADKLPKLNIVPLASAPNDPACHWF